VRFDEGRERVNQTAEIGARSWWTLALTSISVFMVSLETTIIALAFSEIGRAFPDSSAATLSWVFTAYNIGVASLLLIAGWLADSRGRRKMFQLGLIIFAIGSTGSGFATTTQMLLSARVLQSIGGAMLYPASLALLLPAFPIERRQMAIGLWGAMGGLAAALGPSLGGLLIDGFGWRAVFLVNVPFAISCAILTPLKIAESKSDDMPTRVDLIGTPMASLGVGSFILGIVQGRDWGWTSGRILLSFAIGTTLIVAFIFRSLNHESPLFDLKLFRLRSFTVGNVAAVFFVASFFGWVALMASYIQNVWGWSVLRTGFAMAPAPLLSTVLSMYFGRVADEIGNRTLLLVGSATGLAAMLWLVFTMGTEPDYLFVFGPFSILLALSMGTSFAMLIGATMRDVPPSQFGTAGAVRTTVFNGSLAVGIAIAIATVGSPNSPQETLESYRISWLTSAGLFIAMGVTILVGYVNRTSAQTAASQP